MNTTTKTLARNYKELVEHYNWIINNCSYLPKIEISKAKTELKIAEKQLKKYQVLMKEGL